jgi:hypothetical protein
MLLNLGVLLLPQQIYLGELSNHLTVSFLLASEQLTSLLSFLVSDFQLELILVQSIAI